MVACRAGNPEKVATVRERERERERDAACGRETDWEVTPCVLLT